MIFKSKTDRLHQIMMMSVIMTILLVIVFAWVNNSETTAFNLWFTILLLSVSGFLIWITTETYYDISDKMMNYYSGPIRGKVNIENIHKMEVNKTLWVGFKPATSRNGIIIYYNRFDTIYISPEDKKTFVEACLAINPNITIQYF